MGAAYARYSGARGYTPEQFREVAEQIAGRSLADFWNASIKGTEDLSYAEALATYGLRFGAASTRERASLGMPTRNESGRLMIARVARDASPARPAPGLQGDDEILAINERRITADQLNRRLDEYA